MTWCKQCPLALCLSFLPYKTKCSPAWYARGRAVPQVGDPGVLLSVRQCTCWVLSTLPRLRHPGPEVWSLNGLDLLGVPRPSQDTARGQKTVVIMTLRCHLALSLECLRVYGGVLGG